MTMTHYERTVIDRARKMVQSEDVLQLVSTLGSLAALLETRVDMADETQEPEGGDIEWSEGKN